jgi:hypothetical protein
MAEIRTLKLNLLADTKDFAKGLRGARGATKTFAGKLGDYTRTAALGFAALGAAVLGAAAVMGKSMVEAAIADEKSQATLAQTLRNTIGATKDQIKASESWIEVQQKTLGISDTKLRPALGNLVRVTDNLTEAQKLTSLAMDISAGTGKDLETVSLALAKAHEGNLGALKRLGIPLDDSIVKTKDFEGATRALTDLFGGAALANTDTLAGKLGIMREKVGELQESLGALLIPKFTALVDYITNKVIPIIEEIGRGFSGDDNKALSNKVRSLARQMDDKSDAYSLGQALRNVTTAFGGLFSVVKGGESTTGTLESIAKSLETMANAIDAVTGAWKRGKGWLGGFVDFANNVNPANLSQFFTGQARAGNRAAGGFVRKGGSYLVGEHGAEVVTMGSNGSVSRAGAGGTTIIMNGIIDAESARRSIERLLQQSSRRTGGVNFNGALS